METVVDLTFAKKQIKKQMEKDKEEIQFYIKSVTWIVKSLRCPIPQEVHQMLEYAIKSNKQQNGLIFDILEKIPLEDINNIRDLYLISYIYEEKGDYHSAQRYMEKILLQTPKSTKALCRTALMYLPTDAETAYKIALDAKAEASKRPISNKYILPHINDTLIEINEHLEQYDNIIELAEAEKEYNTTDSEVYVFIGKAFNYRNQSEKALLYFEKAMQASLAENKYEKLENDELVEFLPFTIDELIELASLYQKFSRIDDSLKCIQEGFKLIDPKHDPCGYSLLIKRKNELTKLKAKSSIIRLI